MDIKEIYEDRIEEIGKQINQEVFKKGWKKIAQLRAEEKRLRDHIERMK